MSDKAVLLHTPFNMLRFSAALLSCVTLLTAEHQLFGNALATSKHDS